MSTIFLGGWGFGEPQLNFHPHIHVLVTDGGFMRDGAFRPLAWFHSQQVERLFRAEVLRMLLRNELITEAIVDNLLSWRHSGFSVHGAVRVDDRGTRPQAGSGAVRLGHYMIRCPIVLKRLSWEWEAGEIVYRSRRRHPSGAKPPGRRDHPTHSAQLGLDCPQRLER